MVNIAFAGIYPFSEVHLTSLLDAENIRVKYVLTSQRKRPLLSSAFAQKFAGPNAPRFVGSQSELQSLLKSDLSFLESAWLVSAGFPEKLLRSTLELFDGRTMNVHPSLLPEHRGPDPVRRGILDGDNIFGFSFHSLTNRFDVGNIYHQSSMSLSANLITEEVVSRLAAKSAATLVRMFRGEHLWNVKLSEKIKWELHGYENATTRENFQLLGSDSSDQVSRKIRAAGLSREVYWTSGEGRVKTLSAPASLGVQASSYIHLAGNLIEVSWETGGVVTVVYR